MAFDQRVISAAVEQLKSERIHRETETARRRAKIYEDIPEVRDIDRRLRESSALAIKTALEEGENPVEAVAAASRNAVALNRRKEQLLQSAGLSADYLAPPSGCPECHDTGFVGNRMCKCLFRLCVERQKKALSKSLDLSDCTFENFDLTYYSTEADPRFDMSPRENMEYVRDICAEYAQKFGGSCVNLFLNGGTGLGKTYLSGCVASEVSRRGFSVIYDLAGHVMSRYEAMRFDRTDGDALDDTRRYTSCDLLILDDLGTEFASQLNTSALYSIISARLTGKRATIISSNLTIADLTRRYSPQIMSRLGGDYHTLTFFGEDIRMLRRRREMGL